MSENCPVFRWSKQTTLAALALAEGKTQQEVAAEVEVSDRTIRRWLADVDFAAEVDRLSLMVGISSRAERLRLAMRVVRSKTKDEITTEKDLLDWLKFAQSETDGIKLDLPTALAAALSENGASLAASGPGNSTDEPESDSVN